MSRKQKGFTIVELVAVMALLIVVTSLIFSVFISGSNLYSNGMRIEDVETNGRQVMQQLSQNIKTSKILIGTQDLNLNNGSGLNYYINSPVYLDNTSIIRTDLVAYIENYSNKRYIYAFRFNNGKKKLYELTLNDQGNDHYEITTDSVDQTLNTADIIKLTPKNGVYSQEVLRDIDTTVYIDNYSTDHYGSTYSNPWLMYDNYGDDCYLVAYTSGVRVKRKLKKVFKPNLTVISERMIGTNIDSITITNSTNNGEIKINLSSGSMKKTIITSVNILNH